MHGFLFNAHSSPRSCLPPDSIGPEPFCCAEHLGSPPSSLGHYICGFGYAETLLSRTCQAAVPQEKSKFVCNAMNSAIAEELHLPVLARHEDHQPVLFDWRGSVHHATKVLHAFPGKLHLTDAALEYQGWAFLASDLVEIELSRKMCFASGNMLPNAAVATSDSVEVSQKWEPLGPRCEL